METSETVPQPAEATPQTPIEVVHTRATPKLNSILKRRGRTISECSSNDDVCGELLERQCSIGSGIFDSGLSETEQPEVAVCYGGRRKTVSFSEYIEQTMFKKNQSVTTMRTTLKNKKKRARRRQQKEDKSNNGKPNHSKVNGGGGRASKSDEDIDENDDDAEEADDDSGIHSCDDALLSNGMSRNTAEADSNDTNDDDEDDSEAEVASAPAERNNKSHNKPAPMVSSAPSPSGKGRRHAKKSKAKH